MVAPRPPVLLLGAVLFGGCASAGAPQLERGIATTGIGRVAVRPDTAVVDVGVEARAAQLADATGEVNRRMRDLLARVKALGVRDADVRTTVYVVDPIAEPRQPGDASARIVGYRVSNVVQVRTRDVDGLGRIVDAAVTGGANVVGNVQLTLDDPARPEAEARALAMREAAARARQIADAAGVKLGRLLAVTESATRPPVARMSLARAPGPVEPGQLDVTVSLDARYAIEP
ncbi:MAG TPA: SIMPL domain-containing protein [Methylomirabilota bacterium]|nr:SIMPL domain-containing protein [Methylomirabilota bacterium]